MKRLLSLILFLSLAFGQDELIGHWNNSNCKAIIEKKGNKLFIYWNTKCYNQRIYRLGPISRDNFYLSPISRDNFYWSDKKSEIYDPWFGNSYYIHELWDPLAGETSTIKVEIVLINRDNIRINGVLHEKKRLYKP